MTKTRTIACLLTGALSAAAIGACDGDLTGAPTWRASVRAQATQARSTAATERASAEPKAPSPVIGVELEDLRLRPDETESAPATPSAPSPGIAVEPEDLALFADETTSPAAACATE